MPPVLVVIDQALCEAVRRSRPMPVIDALLDIRNAAVQAQECDALERLARNS